LYNPVLQPVERTVAVRSTRLSNGLYNRFHNRFDNRLDVCETADVSRRLADSESQAAQLSKLRVALAQQVRICLAPFTRYNLLSYRLTTGCNVYTAGCQTGWMFVYTIQPVVKPVVQPV